MQLLEDVESVLPRVEPCLVVSVRKVVPGSQFNYSAQHSQHSQLLTGLIILDI